MDSIDDGKHEDHASYSSQPDTSMNVHAEKTSGEHHRQQASNHENPKIVHSSTDHDVSKKQKPHKKKSTHHQFLQWLKDPYFLAFIALLIITIIVRSKFMLQPSLWVDETHYMLFGSKLLSNPLGLISHALINNVQFPAIIVAVFSLIVSPFAAGRVMNLFFIVIGVGAMVGIGKEFDHPIAGMFAGLLLVFNPLHWFNGSRALVDVPLASMITVFLYTLIRFSRNKTWKNGIILAIITILTIFTKLPGGIVLLIFVAYMIYYYSIAPIIDFHLRTQQKIFRSKWLYICGAIVLFVLLLVWNSITSFIRGNITFRTDYIQNVPFVIGFPLPSMWLYIFVGIVLYIAIALYLRKHEQLTLPIAFILFLTAFSVLLGGMNPRYILPIVPPLLLMFTVCIAEVWNLIAMIFPKRMHAKTIGMVAIVVVLGILMLPSMYTAGTRLILDKYHTYTEYDKAGAWLATTEEDALIYVMSTSWASLFSSRDVIQAGGVISNTVEFQSPEELLELTRGTNRPVYIVFDIWESWAQPPWYSQWMQNSHLWDENGFALAHVEQVQFPRDKSQIFANFKFFETITTEGTEETGGIFVFRYDPGQNMVQNEV